MAECEETIDVDICDDDCDSSDDEDIDRDVSKSCSSAEGGNRKKQSCRRCAIHGQKDVPKKGHKPFCPYASCSCNLCDMQNQHNQVMAKQISIRRKNIKDKEQQETITKLMCPQAIVNSMNLYQLPSYGPLVGYGNMGSSMYSYPPNLLPVTPSPPNPNGSQFLYPHVHNAQDLHHPINLDVHHPCCPAHVQEILQIYQNNKN